MPNFFVSWSLPDRARVRPILTALRLHGVNLWEYTNGMPAGGNIVGNVAAAIEDAHHAIFLFSDATANRDWIERETTLANARLQQKKLESIIPVWVGPHPDDLRPKDLSKEISIRDLSDNDATAIENFAREVAAKQEPNAVISIPAAVFAMTRSQATSLFGKWTAEFEASRPWQHEVRRLCANLGMSKPPQLFSFLAMRYKDRPEDFAPFRDSSIADILLKALERVNARRDRKDATLAITWVHNDFAQEGLRELVRSDWEDHPSLLIADSISMYHEDIERLVLQLPEFTKSSILWIPPYTQRTARLQPHIERAVKRIERFGDAFSKMREWPAAFDANTPQAIDRWLADTLMDIRRRGPTPYSRRVNQMKQRPRHRAKVEPRTFYKTT